MLRHSGQLGIGRHAVKFSASESVSIAGDCSWIDQSREVKVAGGD